MTSLRADSHLLNMTVTYSAIVESSASAVPLRTNSFWMSSWESNGNVSGSPFGRPGKSYLKLLCLVRSGCDNDRHCVWVVWCTVALTFYCRVSAEQEWKAAQGSLMNGIHFRKWP